VPDLESLPTRLLRARWPLLLPERLIYFSRRSLRLSGESASLTWICFGRRLASFSVRYLFHRRAQHTLAGATSAARTYISDLGRLWADYPGWQITRSLDDIFRELARP